MSKEYEKAQAITLRKKGKTYNEILEQVDVSKSTLSLWLRDVGLATPQKQRLTKKKLAAAQRGGDRRREMRMMETKEIEDLCLQDIKTISDRELFLIGVALYWAEGAKKNADKASIMVDFGNSDPAMIRLFVRWLIECLSVDAEDIEFRLHLHENHAHREAECKKVWESHIPLTHVNFTKTNYKKHNVKTVRKKIDISYIGLVSVRVKKSTILNRRIMGWIYAIISTQK